jgi:hypothetical protein
MWGYGQDWLPFWTIAKAEPHPLSSEDCASFDPSDAVQCSVCLLVKRAYLFKLLNEAASNRSAVMCVSVERCFVEQQLWTWLERLRTSIVANYLKVVTVQV